MTRNAACDKQQNVGCLFQFYIPVGEGVGRSQLQWRDLGLRWRRLHAGLAAYIQRGQGSDPVLEGQPVDRSWHSRSLRRFHRLQRKHQPLLRRQVN